MPEQTLQSLMEGNQRYISNKPALDETEHRRLEVALAQKPFAAVLSCIDSRVIPELIFDQGLGELLVVRTAGQVLDKAVLGSLEFGVAELHIPLIVVLGHEHCGAVKAAMEALEHHETAQAEIEYLVEELAQAVEEGKKGGGDEWDHAVRAQIEILVAKLKHSPILASAVDEGILKIVGAWYNLETGLVEITVK